MERNQAAVTVDSWVATMVDCWEVLSAEKSVDAKVGY